MKKRMAAVVVAAAAFCGVLPATAATAGDCQMICLMCDTGDCPACIEQSVLGRPYSIC